MDSLFKPLSEFELSAIWLSLKFALLSNFILLPITLFLAWITVYKNFRGKSVIISLFNLPLIIPPVSTGFLLLLLFSRNYFVGKYFYESLNIQIAFSQMAAVIAGIVASFPLMYRSFKIAFEMIDEKLLEASYSLGWTKFSTFFKVIVPLSIPGIIGGFILGIARCFGEFGATVIFAGNIPYKTQTIPLAIYNFIQIPGKELFALRLVIFSIIISIVAISLAELFNKNKLIKYRLNINENI